MSMLIIIASFVLAIPLTFLSIALLSIPYFSVFSKVGDYEGIEVARSVLLNNSWKILIFGVTIWTVVLSMYMSS